MLYFNPTAELNRALSDLSQSSSKEVFFKDEIESKILSQYTDKRIFKGSQLGKVNLKRIHSVNDKSCISYIILDWLIQSHKCYYCSDTQKLRKDSLTSKLNAFDKKRILHGLCIKRIDTKYK